MLRLTDDWVTEFSNCTGCMLCKSVCPTEAIDYYEGELGFIYPRIDKTKCIDCHKCVNVCPSRKCYDTLPKQKCYAVQASDTVRMNSSSGGMFYVIAHKIINIGGAVCGARFEGEELRHVIIDNELQILDLCKSKYVQSNMTYIYDEISVALKKYVAILFVGTPCQCSAIKTRFSNNDKLILMDILCMGVPSQKTFSKYLKEENLRGIKNINFRDKDYNGWTPKLVLSYIKQNQKEKIEWPDSSYFAAFLKGLSIRDACTHCQYAGKKRIGDITIGDFWNIGSYSFKLDDKKGTSLVLINSDKGEELINECKGDFILFEEVPIEVAYEGNPVLLAPTGNTYSRECFKKGYYKKSISENFEDCNSSSAQCGIINYWNCDDNGAILTAFALQKSLSNMNISSLLINIGALQTRNGNGISRAFESKYLRTTLPVYEDSICELNERFSTFIVGSDQVFRREWVTDDFFLKFANDKKKKIAVAASFGTDKLNITECEKRKITYLLKRFNAISVRETSGKNILNSLGINGKQIIDPVFWLTRWDYIDLLGICAENIKYMVAYLRDQTPEKIELCNSLAIKNKAKLVFVTNETPVEKFLQYVMNAMHIVTDSYHGLCFALIFNVNYTCIYNELRGNARFVSLIEILNLSANNFVEEIDIENYVSDNTDYDWEKINDAISAEAFRSRKWIRKRIDEPNRILLNKIRTLRYMLWINFADIIYMESSFLKMKLQGYSPKVVCYGAGCIGNRACQEVSDIDFFIDNNKKIRRLNNYPVFTWAKAKRIISAETQIIVTTTDKYSREIVNSLECEGYCNCTKF